MKMFKPYNKIISIDNYVSYTRKCLNIYCVCVYIYMYTYHRLMRKSLIK